MASMLSTSQLEELGRVLAHYLRNMDITERTVSEMQKNTANATLLEAFISAKRIEGCSEKSLKYIDAEGYLFDRCTKLNKIILPEGFPLEFK